MNLNKKIKQIRQKTLMNGLLNKNDTRDSQNKDTRYWHLIIKERKRLSFYQSSATGGCVNFDMLMMLQNTIN